MAEKRTIELEVQSNTKSLKAQLKEAQMEVQNLADKYGATSVQAANAAKKAAELKDRIGDAKALTDAFNPDAKFKAFTATLSGVASGFSAVQGAMGLVGAEGEDVQKAMLKVQSAMALSQGLQGLGEAKDAFKNLGGVVKDTFRTLSSESSLAGKATNALGPIWKTVGASGESALKGIRTGIAATGIGLLVIALGAVVAYWDDIKAAVSGVNSETEKGLENARKKVKSAENELELFDLQENSLKLQGKSEKDILKIRGEKIKSIITEQQAEIDKEKLKQKLELQASERNRKIAEGLIRLQVEGLLLITRLAVAPIDLVMVGINQALKALGKGELQLKPLNESLSEFATYASKGLSGMLFNTDKIKEEGDAAVETLQKNLDKTKSTLDGNTLEIQAIDKKNADDAQKNADDAQKKKEEANKIYNDNLKAFYEAQEADRQARIKDASEKELQELANKFDEQSLIYDLAGKDTTELTKQYEADRIATKEKYRKLDEANAIIAEEKLQKFMQEADAKAFSDQVVIRELEIKAMQDGAVKELAIKKLALDQELVNLQNQKDAKLLTEEQYQTLSKEANARYQKAVTDTTISENDKRIKAENAAYEQKAALQMQALDLAAQGVAVLKDIFGKNKAIQKGAILVESAVGIAKMIISNKLANIAALATPQAVASSGAAAAPVIAMNNISTGIGIAANIAATAKALKELGGGSAPSAGGVGGGGGVVGGGAGGGTQAPQFNVVGNNGMNQLAQLQQKPVQAYVVSGEVTSAQALDRNRITNGTL